MCIVCLRVDVYFIVGVFMYFESGRVAVYFIGGGLCIMYSCMLSVYCIVRRLVCIVQKRVGNSPIMPIMTRDKTGTSRYNDESQTTFYLESVIKASL